MEKTGDLSNQSKFLYALILIPFVFSGFTLSDAIKTVGWDFEQITTSSVFFYKTKSSSLETGGPASI